MSLVPEKSVAPETEGLALQWSVAPEVEMEASIIDPVTPISTAPVVELLVPTSDLSLEHT